MATYLHILHDHRAKRIDSPVGRVGLGILKSLISVRYSTGWFWSHCRAAYPLDASVWKNGNEGPIIGNQYRPMETGIGPGPHFMRFDKKQNKLPGNWHLMALDARHLPNLLLTYAILGVAYWISRCCYCHGTDTCVTFWSGFSERWLSIFLHSARLGLRSQAEFWTGRPGQSFVIF